MTDQTRSEFPALPKHAKRRNCGSDRTSPLLNVMFPLWMLMCFPTPLWLVILPANFIIDSAVVAIAAKVRKVEGIFKLWKQTILKVWFLGFLSDILGAGVVGAVWMLVDAIGPNVALGLFPATTLTAIPGVAVAGLLIYVLNKRFTFKNIEIDDRTKHVICLALALVTAPYTMMIPIFG